MKNFIIRDYVSNIKLLNYAIYKIKADNYESLRRELLNIAKHKIHNVAIWIENIEKFDMVFIKELIIEAFEDQNEGEILLFRGVENEI